VPEKLSFQQFLNLHFKSREKEKRRRMMKKKKRRRRKA
jgi:hypothetical protein